LRPGQENGEESQEGHKNKQYPAPKLNVLAASLRIKDILFDLIEQAFNRAEH
jgi:hypothetical protein